MKKVFLLLTLFFFPLFAHEVDEIAKTILQSQPSSVEGYVNGKLYLKTDRILPTAQGLLLHFSGITVQLPTLHSDSMGCYLSVSDDLVQYYVCSNSQCRNMWNVWQGSTCRMCGSPGRLTAP